MLNLSTWISPDNASSSFFQVFCISFLLHMCFSKRVFSPDAGQLCLAGIHEVLWTTRRGNATMFVDMFLPIFTLGKHTTFGLRSCAQCRRGNLRRNTCTYTRVRSHARLECTNRQTLKSSCKWFTILLGEVSFYENVALSFPSFRSERLSDSDTAEKGPLKVAPFRRQALRFQSRR